MYGQVFANRFKVHKMTTTNNDQLAAGTDLPASGSYIDVSAYERFHIICHLGAVDASDAPVLEPKCSDAVDGTLDAIDATDLQHTAANDDDNEFIVWTIETRKLAADHYYVALDVEGGVTNGSYADVYLLGESNVLPVTQTTSVLPTASQHRHTGGD